MRPHSAGDCKRESSPRAALQLAKMHPRMGRRGPSRVRPGGAPNTLLGTPTARRVLEGVLGCAETSLGCAGLLKAPLGNSIIRTAGTADQLIQDEGSWLTALTSTMKCCWGKPKPKTAEPSDADLIVP